MDERGTLTATSIGLVPLALSQSQKSEVPESESFLFLNQHFFSLDMGMKRTGREKAMARKSINGRASSFCLVHVYTLAIRLHLKTIMRNRQFPCRPQRHRHPPS